MVSTPSVPTPMTTRREWSPGGRRSASGARQRRKRRLQPTSLLRRQISLDSRSQFIPRQRVRADSLSKNQPPRWRKCRPGRDRNLSRSILMVLLRISMRRLPTPNVAPQAQDLSSQPQPVYPPEPAPAETAAAEPTPAEPAPQPEPAPAEPSQAVTAETPSEAKPAEEPKKAPVVFKSVDYQDTGAESGKVALSGSGEPGARIFLYIDETPLGELSVGSDGSWTFEADRKLATGEHKFRADSVDESSRVVIGSAMIGIVRMEPPKEEVAAAPAAPPPSPSAEAAPGAAAPPPEPEQETAAAEETKPEAHGKGSRPAARVHRAQRRHAVGHCGEPITAAAGVIAPSCATTAARSATRTGSIRSRNFTCVRPSRLRAGSPA